MKILFVGSWTDKDGAFSIDNIPFGAHTVIVSFMGYKSLTKTVDLNASSQNVEMQFVLTENPEHLNEVFLKVASIKSEIEKKGFAVNVIETKEASYRNLQTNELLNRSVGVKVR